MANLFRDGAAWMAEQLETHASSAGTYYTPGGSIPLAVTIGQSTFEETQVDQVVRTMRTVDLIFRRSLLDIGGTIVEPRLEHYWTAADGGGTFQLFAPDGDRCFRFEDHYGILIRVYTRRTDDEQP